MKLTLRSVVWTYLAVAAISLACALTGCQSNSDALTPNSIPSSNNVYFGAANAVTAAENVTMAALGAHKITPAQAQTVADQCKAIRSAIAAAEAASAPTGSAAADDINKLVAGLQGYVSGLVK